MKKEFGIEIIDCENGFIVLEGNSMLSHYPMQRERKKWICKTPEDLAMLVKQLAEGDQTKESK